MTHKYNCPYGDCKGQLKEEGEHEIGKDVILTSYKCTQCDSVWIHLSNVQA